MMDLRDSRQLGDERAASTVWRSALDAMPDGCQVLDSDWRYLYVNDACAKHARRARAELLGRTMLECFPGIDETPVFADLRRCMDERVPIERDSLFTYPDGTRAAFELRIVPVPQGICVFSVDVTERREQLTAIVYGSSDAAGALVGTSQIIRDVRDLRAARGELELARDEAQHASRELESFAYSVAHDLRAPLRAIDGFSQALLEDHGSRLDASGLRYLDLVRGAAQKMALLIDDLLALSRVSRHELHRTEVDVTRIAGAILDRLARREPGRRVQLTIEPKLIANADPRLLEVVLENLLTNAWKFSSRKAITQIEVGSEPNQGEPALFVRDEGAGFDMAYADKLFGVFSRLHTEAEFEGTGIGLATVQRIIQRHHGRVWGEGGQGRGACFRFTLGSGGILPHGGGE